MAEIVLLGCILVLCVSLVILACLVLLKVIEILELLWHMSPRETRCVKELAWGVSDISEAVASGNHTAVKHAVAQLEVKAAKVKDAGLA